jgi:ribosomal protein S18 acetylase RimI-like enzyme
MTSPIIVAARYRAGCASVLLAFARSFPRKATMTLLIRPYAPGDAEQITTCIEELQDYERALEPDRVEGCTIARRYLEDLLASCQQKQGIILVAVADVQTIVGFVCLWLEHEPETYLSTLTEYAYISDVVVRAPYRQQGIGQVLLAHAETYARQVHARTLRIHVLAANTAARHSYQRAGFREYELSLLKPLS